MLSSRGMLFVGEEMLIFYLDMMIAIGPCF